MPRSMQEILDHADALAACLTWKQIGEQIGTSAQGAQQRYGTLTTPT